jgi:hypothetical protein
MARPAIQDFGPGGFDFKNVLGKGCLLTIAQDEFNGDTRALVSNVAKVMRAKSSRTQSIRASIWG